MALGGEEGAECAADEEGEGQPRKHSNNNK